MADQEWKHLRTKDIKPIDLSHTYVITMCSNPARYRSRYDAHRRFVKHMADSGAQLIVVEVAYGMRPFEVTEAGNPFHVQLRSEFEEVWLKEWCQNRGLKELFHIDPNWEHVIFSDNDITWTSQRWINETVHQLQSHMVVQPFRQMIDLGPNNEILLNESGSPAIHNSFAYMYHENNFQPPEGAGYSTGYYYGGESKGKFWHPGYAMAFRRECFEGGGLPGLLTTGILGSGDHHMWLCLIGQGQKSLPQGIHPNYRKEVMRWQADCERVVKRDIGFVDDLATHAWGGPKPNRNYQGRWEIITSCNYDPEEFIRLDHQGLPQLIVQTPDQIRFRDLARNYFRVRQEDDSSYRSFNYLK